MHKACRLVAGSESAICASGLLALHQSYAADPKLAVNLHKQPTQQTAGPQAAWFQSQNYRSALLSEMIMMIAAHAWDCVASWDPVHF